MRIWEKVAIGAGIVGAAVLGVVAIVEARKKQSSGGGGGSQTPTWTQLTADQNQNITLPTNGTIAIAATNSDPATAQLVADLETAQTNGAITSLTTYAAGTNPPAGWPNDGLGGNGVRFTFVVNTGWMLALPTSAAAWVFSGVKG